MPRPPLFTAPFIRSWIFTLITFSTAFQLFPTIPFRIRELGGSTAQAGLFLAIYTYACALSAPLTGAVADRFGRKRVLMIAAGAFSVASFLYGITSNFYLLLAVGCVHGIFWSALLSSNSAIISEIIPESRRTEGIAYWGMASTVAVAIAPAIGLLVYRRGWFVLCLELTALGFVMIYLASRIPLVAASHADQKISWHSLIDVRVTIVALSLFVLSISYGGITSYVAFLSEERGIVPKSLFFSVTAAAIIISRLLTSKIADRHGPLALLIPSLALVAPGVALLAIAQTRWMLVASAIIYGIGFGGAYPAFVTFILPRTDPRIRAAVFGGILLAFDTGIGTGSFITGKMAQVWGFRTAFLANACVAALSLPLFLLTSRRLFAEPKGPAAAGGHRP